jgi:hypothetical protein
VRRSPAGFPTCPGFAAIEAECSRPYLPISRFVVLHSRTAQSIESFGPAMNPSSDIVMCQITLLITRQTPTHAETHRPSSPSPVRRRRRWPLETDRRFSRRARSAARGAWRSVLPAGQADCARSGHYALHGSCPAGPTFDLTRCDCWSFSVRDFGVAPVATRGPEGQAPPLSRTTANASASSSCGPSDDWHWRRPSPCKPGVTFRSRIFARGSAPGSRAAAVDVRRISARRAPRHRLARSSPADHAEPG